MPRLNDVRLVGIVSDFPSIKYGAQGELVQVALPILSVHGTRSYGDQASRDTRIRNKGYETLWISSRDPEMMSELAQRDPYDAVEIKGVIRETVVKKKAYCPECNEKYLYTGQKVTIYPIYFRLRTSFLKEFGISDVQKISTSEESRVKEAAIRYLDDCVEISNTAKVIGVVAADPSMYQRDSDGKLIMSFPLAVKRHYYIAEDDMSATVDFPFVKLYGKPASEQDGRLHKGNLLLIDGFVTSRDIIRKIACPKCEIRFPVNSNVTELVPYSIEYLRDDVTQTERFGERPASRPKRIGTEADADLANIYMTNEQRSDEQIASGEAPSWVDPAIVDAVCKDDETDNQD